MRAERDALFRYLPEFVEAEDLEAARVGQDSAWPRHESVQSAHFSDWLNTGSEIEVIGVAEQDFDVKLFQNVLRYAFDRGECANRHEDRCLHVSMRCSELAGTC